MPFTVFNASNPLMVEEIYSGFGAHMGSYRYKLLTLYLTSTMSGFDGLKTVKCLFFHFAIKQWKKTFRKSVNVLYNCWTIAPKITKKNEKSWKFGCFFDLIFGVMKRTDQKFSQKV